MEELHGYVAKKTSEATFESRSEGISVTYTKDHLHPILFGGDQLTCARVHSCQRARMNSDCASDSLLGLVPCCEDWHAKMTFLSVSFCILTKICTLRWSITNLWKICPLLYSFTSMCIFIFIVGHLEEAVQAYILFRRRDPVSLTEHCPPYQCYK